MPSSFVAGDPIGRITRHGEKVSFGKYARGVKHLAHGGAIGSVYLAFDASLVAGAAQDLVPTFIEVTFKAKCSLSTPYSLVNVQTDVVENASVRSKSKLVDSQERVMSVCVLESAPWKWRAAFHSPARLAQPLRKSLASRLRPVRVPDFRPSGGARQVFPVIPEVHFEFYNNQTARMFFEGFFDDHVNKLHCILFADALRCGSDAGTSREYFSEACLFTAIDEAMGACVNLAIGPEKPIVTAKLAVEFCNRISLSQPEPFVALYIETALIGTTTSKSRLEVESFAYALEESSSATPHRRMVARAHSRFAVLSPTAAL